LAESCAASRGTDRAAFEELHRRLGPGIRGFFLKRLRSGRREDSIEDLCQRVWTGLFEAFSQGRYEPDRASISTFVFAIATKTWMRFLRESRRGGRGLSDNPAFDDVEALPGDETVGGMADSAELLEAVRRCLRDRESVGSLTDEEHAILVAAAAGASDRTLAERLGLAASTVNAKKQTGWEKMRRYLARLGHRVESSERDTDPEE
jgi:RNA polymerase sigma factor (sigma-70 family)